MKASATEAEHAIAAAQQRKQWHRGGKTPYLIILFRAIRRPFRAVERSPRFLYDRC